MYQHFFGLTAAPFHPTPDPRFLYTSPSHREALASLIYGVEQRQGFATIIGEVGVGKTTILRTFLEYIDSEKDRTIYIYNSNLTFKALLQRILDELGQEPSSHEVEGMIRQLQDILILQYRKQGTIVLLIDEAQNMPIATLENLRMLSNIETTTDKLLQIVLIGQPELDALLNEHALRQLRQRITIRALIKPLTKEESVAYIQHRLAKSGARLGSIFASQAIKLIVKASNGIPRRLNILCGNSLLTGFGYGKKPITSKIVKEVISDIDGTQTATVKKWLPAAIAALLALVMVPWLLANHDLFSPHSPEESHASLPHTGEKHRIIGQPPNNVEPALRSSQATNKKEQTASSSAHSPTPSVHTQILALGNTHKKTGEPGQSRLEAETRQDSVNDEGQNDIAQILEFEKKKISKSHSQNTTVEDSQLSQENQNPGLASRIIQDKNNRSSSAAISKKQKTKLKTAIHTNSASAQQHNHTGLPSLVTGASNTSALHTYIIQSGDTLDSLLRTRYGRSSPTRMKRLLKHNPHIKSPSQLYPGQQIIFPNEGRE